MARGFILTSVATLGAVGSLVYPAGAILPGFLVGDMSPTNTIPTGGSTPTSPASHTIDGDAIDTWYGPVQVQISVTGKTIDAVNMLQVPNGRNQQFTDYAVPTLIQEAMQAQSGQISGVSGATHTSDAFIQSLQSAVAKI